MKIRNWEVESIGGKKKCPKQKKKRQQRMEDTKLLVGSRSQRVSGWDGCRDEGRRKSKRKRSNKMQNVDKIREQSG